MAHVNPKDIPYDKPIICALMATRMTIKIRMEHDFKKLFVCGRVGGSAISKPDMAELGRNENPIRKKQKSPNELNQRGFL